MQVFEDPSWGEAQEDRKNIELIQKGVLNKMPKIQINYIRVKKTSGKILADFVKYKENDQHELILIDDKSGNEIILGFDNNFSTLKLLKKEIINNPDIESISNSEIIRKIDFKKIAVVGSVFAGLTTLGIILKKKFSDFLF